MKLKFKLLIPVIFGCLLAKCIEWVFQASTQALTGGFLPFEPMVVVSQLIFLCAAAISFFLVLGCWNKSKLYFMIPALYYFIKELYNTFITFIIYPELGMAGIANPAAVAFGRIIPLVLEPLAIGLPAGYIVFAIWNRFVNKTK